ncbi:hypothetical protein [Bradyrhizobium sp. SZCCHNRI1073]|uniref:hypothetical protein n=1 Tax=Bradyrhizobium sp. SZCCHNRI1073 TaxID=3057280 RepID=UPI0029169FD8|nr:hypothetical protein [Bradyrhizobium sp. SZCCHNRI1073]
MTIETSVFVPAMRDGEPCPYCGGPTVNVADEYITCGAAWNRECFGHQVQTPVHHLPGHQETMAGLSALKIRH